MKLISFFVLILMTSVSYSQDSTKVRPCNQLPIAGVEKKASFDGNIEKLFSDNLTSVLKKGTHSAVFKLMVDCYGVPEKPAYQSGTFSESDQKLFIELISKTKWKPAIDKSVNVTTFVFVTVNIVNSKVIVVVQ